RFMISNNYPSGLSGEVLIDGAPQPPNFKCLSGYVVQDDVVMGSLTVRQNLRFSAALRLPESVPQREKEARVNHLITELGLTKVADSKKLKITLMLYLDHILLIHLFFRMAEQGKNIILSIHQPRYSIYRLFDTLTLLVSGKLVYHGRAQSALAVFNKIGYHCEQNDNPADFFLDVINGNHTAAPIPPLGACPEGILYTVPSKSLFTPSHSMFIYFDFLHSELFIRERTLFNHEYISGYYRVSVYFIAKMLSDLVWRSVIISVFSCIVYFMIGFKSTPENFFIFLLTMLLVSYAATSLTVAVSADQTVISVANVIMSMCFVVMMLFSGLLVNLPSVMAWLSWVKYLSIPRYGFTALNINELVGLNFCGDTATQNGTGCSGEQHLEYQGIDYSYWGLWQNHLALALMMILFQTIAYLKLRFIKKFS
uniref:ABC-type xenobiotic transporter n=1 Tax=Acanthochromis polyacanthus TaxID=80966 RepID=A0A3Q1GUM1_9TELE